MTALRSILLHRASLPRNLSDIEYYKNLQQRAQVSPKEWQHVRKVVEEIDRALILRTS